MLQQIACTQTLLPRSLKSSGETKEVHRELQNDVMIQERSTQDPVSQ